MCRLTREILTSLGITIEDDHYSFIVNLFKELEENHPYTTLETFKKKLHYEFNPIPFSMIHTYEENLEGKERLCPVGYLRRNSKKRLLGHQLAKSNNAPYKKYDETYYDYYMLCVSDKNRYYMFCLEDPDLKRYDSVKDLVCYKYTKIPTTNDNMSVHKNMWNVYDVPEEDSLSRLLGKLEEF